MQILSLVNFVAAVQGLFLAYLFFNNKAHQKDSRILALLVLVMSIGIMGPALGLSGYYKEFPHLIRIGDPMAFLIGPLLFFYIHVVLYRILPRRFYLHLIPFVIYLVQLIPFYALSGEAKIAFGENIFLNKHPNPFIILIQSLRSIHCLVYLILSLKLIKQLKKALRDNFSDLTKLNFNQAEYLLKLFAFVAFIGICIYIFSLFIPVNFVVINSIIGLAICMVIYSLAYTSWNRIPVIIAQSETIADKKSTVENYLLSEEHYETYAATLDRLLTHDKIFFRNDLSLSQLSEALKIQPYHTSEVIKRKYKEPFFDLINRFRVEEVKARLSEERYAHYSILGIAMDCGFNSKSSFNTAFKKFAGLTPSQYRKNAPVKTVV